MRSYKKLYDFTQKEKQLLKIFVVITHNHFS